MFYSKIENIESLKIHYDTNIITNYKLTDLTNNGNDGYIKKCEIIHEDVAE